MPRAKKRYNDVIKPELMKKFGYKNAMQVPKINKVVLNIGAGEGASDGKKIQQAQNDLTAIAGQKAIITRAKKAIATFKITAGRPIGVKVTLRGDGMYEFIDRLITTALPRVARLPAASIPRASDGQGTNYAMGLKEHIVFVEIDYDKTETVWGMDIVFNTSAKNDAEAKALLEGFQFPFTNFKDRRAMAKQSQINREQEARTAGRANMPSPARGAQVDRRGHEGARAQKTAFAARLKLAKLPRNSSKTRIHHRMRSSADYGPRVSIAR